MINYRYDLRDMDYSDAAEIIFKDVGHEPEWFETSEDDLLPYETMDNIDKAYQIVSDAVRENKRIMVHADCDADGVSAGTIIYQYLKNYTSDIDIMINDGKAHGLESVENIWCDLLIVTDSMNEAEVYERFKHPDIVVLDHHIPSPNLPKNVTLVSAMNSKNPNLSGSGVVWKFCKYYDLMELNDYADDLVDLATVGIIGDMMDMSVRENRYICSLGLNHIVNPGIKKIVGGYDFTAKTVSFSVAPLINACNRLHQNKLALDFFNTDDKKTINSMYKELKAIKEEQDSVIDKFDEDTLNIHDKFIYTFSDEKDLSGVLANKISGKYHKPTLVLREIDGVVYGSMRGFGTENFSVLLESTELCQCFGHENSAGVEINQSDFDEFVTKLDEVMKDVSLVETTDADYLIDYRQIPQFIDLSKYINKISGTGFKSITFVVETDEFEYATMKDGLHMKLMLEDNINLIKWKDSTLPGKKIRACGSLESSWFGRTFTKNMIIDKIEVAE